MENFVSRSAADMPGGSRLAKTEQDAESAVQTPQEWVDRIHALFRNASDAGIDLDPCTVPENPVGAARFYTPADDGILQRWDAQTIYVNPPYGKTIGKWIEKCAYAAQTTQGPLGVPSKVIALVPARVGSAWFNRAWDTASEVLFVNGRITFRDQPAAARFPSAFFAWNISLFAWKRYGRRVLLSEGEGVAD